MGGQWHLMLKTGRLELDAELELLKKSSQDYFFYLENNFAASSRR